MTPESAHVMFAVVLVSASLSAAAAPDSPRPALIPRPARIEWQPGQFELGARTVIIAGKDARTEAAALAQALRQSTGQPLKTASRPPSRNCIELAIDPSLASRLGQEGYLLSVTPERVLVRAAGQAGLFYGGVTLRQLFPPEIFALSPSAPGPWKAACAEIEDQPRFAWRGLLLDVARHYMPPEFIRKLVDVAALHKLNSLQLHLTDDQGWRLEIKKYPRLTQVGAIRKESPRPGKASEGDETPYGPFFYTQKEVRSLVAYAQARHVTLVPEIEIPGHFTGALAAYPELSCRGGPFAVRTLWGIEADILCAGNDRAVAFLEEVLGEVAALFPSRFIHIGGDEAPRDRWNTCPKCQARIKAAGLKSEAQLQSWLNLRLEHFLASKGRRLIGWDEILEGGLGPDTAVMSWRGTAGGMAAAQSGHDVVMSPTTHCYFDYAQARGPGEPECIGGFIPLQTVYEFEPMPASLDESKRPQLLGVQGNLWTEFMRTPQDVEYFAFPRAVALSEVAWSPATGKDIVDFLQRLNPHLRRLDLLRVNYRKP
jgi:hexosaminidase